jgi:D-alanyl-D-alanine carboxypeptidase
MYLKRLLFLTLAFYALTPALAVTINQEAIQTVLDKTVTEYQLPGVEVTIQDKKSHYSWHFVSGVADTTQLTPLKTTHLMQIGSTTKSFIASLILMLESDSEKGLLKEQFNIDQPLGLWLPEYSAWKDVKIKQLLNMTSGIYNYTDEDKLFIELAKTPHMQWSASELAHLAYDHVPNTYFVAGQGYEYSNTNYILVGLIIEKLTHKSLKEVIDERILRKYPQLFKHTFYDTQCYPDCHLAEMAHGYMMEPSQHHPQFYQQDITDISLSWAGAAGGLISNSEDLANWINLLFSKHFLGKKQQGELKNLVCIDEQCIQGEPISRKSHYMGYGLGVGRIYDPDYGDLWTHSGGTLGYHTLFIYAPKLAVNVTVLINQIGPKIEDEDDATYIVDKIFNILRGVRVRP